MFSKPQLILLIGAPSTGKTSVLESLKFKGYECLDEVSRQVVLDARVDGYEYLFKEKPLLFSEKLLEGRLKQFKTAKASTSQFVFLDRGLPDITAYLDMVNTSYPKDFTKANTKFIYDKVFWFPIWSDIFETDNERYEDLELSKQIEDYILVAYQNIGYNLIEVPKYSVESRVDFILSHLK